MASATSRPYTVQGLNSALSLAAFPISEIQPGFDKTSSKQCWRASVDPASINHPFSLWLMMSGPAVRSVVITGVPCDIASVITIPENLQKVKGILRHHVNALVLIHLHVINSESNDAFSMLLLKQDNGELLFAQPQSTPQRP